MQSRTTDCGVSSFDIPAAIGCLKATMGLPWESARVLGGGFHRLLVAWRRRDPSTMAWHGLHMALAFLDDRARPAGGYVEQSGTSATAVRARQKTSKPARYPPDSGLEMADRPGPTAAECVLGALCGDWQGSALSWTEGRGDGKIARGGQGRSIGGPPRLMTDLEDPHRHHDERPFQTAGVCRRKWMCRWGSFARESWDPRVHLAMLVQFLLPALGVVKAERGQEAREDRREKTEERRQKREERRESWAAVCSYTAYGIRGVQQDGIRGVQQDGMLCTTYPTRRRLERTARARRSSAAAAAASRRVAAWPARRPWWLVGQSKDGELRLCRDCTLAVSTALPGTSVDWLAAAALPLACGWPFHAARRFGWGGRSIG
ncbi:uncharacterized protein EKO05_0006879 [Ascochyta rabiei]|uniref:uncharacterized protein n=1 Tax=Didymella rabiei TaxID=5454 RepID=UPI00220E78E8|nr:uncharacterized protein EKO05_0006879 [Ascochyta rabiei]UPX16481.1 hypothetical protein EKO05_0006879 [Ascochyta rabiei]